MRINIGDRALGKKLLKSTKAIARYAKSYEKL
jgi:hypothetical protein